MTAKPRRIVVAASSEDEETAEELAGQLQETIEQEDTENGDTVEVEAVSVGLERVQKAGSLAVTPASSIWSRSCRRARQIPRASISSFGWRNPSKKS